MEGAEIRIAISKAGRTHAAILEAGRTHATILEVCRTHAASWFLKITNLRTNVLIIIIGTTIHNSVEMLVRKELKINET